MTEAEALKFAAQILRIDDTMFYDSKPHEEAIALLEKMSENPKGIEYYRGFMQSERKEL